MSGLERSALSGRRPGALGAASATVPVALFRNEACSALSSAILLCCGCRGRIVRSDDS